MPQPLTTVLGSVPLMTLPAGIRAQISFLVAMDSARQFSTLLGCLQALCDPCIRTKGSTIIVYMGPINATNMIADN